MLQIILQILAIIGIIILCIIGVFILLVIIVLFCPLRYYLKGSKQDDEIRFSIHLSYLLHVITLRYLYPEPGNLEIRIFGIPYKAKAKIKPKEKSKQNSSEEVFKEKKETVQEKQTVSVKQENIHVQSDINVDLQNSNVKFLRHPFKWIYQKIKKIYYTIKLIYDKMKHIIQNITYYKDVITDPANQGMYVRMKDIVLHVFKKVLPKNYKAELIIGTGSPDTTGYLCGIYGILLPVFSNRVEFTPDFEQAIYNVKIKAKGHIRFITLLTQAGKIYFDKQVKTFVNQLKREEA